MRGRTSNNLCQRRSVINPPVTQTAPFKGAVIAGGLLIALIAVCLIHPGIRSWILTKQWNIGEGVLTIALPITALSIGIPVIIFIKQKYSRKEEGGLEESLGYTPPKKYLSPPMKKILLGAGITTVAALIIGGAIAFCAVPALQNVIHHKMSVAMHALVIGVPSLAVGAGFNFTLFLYYRRQEERGSQLINQLYAEIENERLPLENNSTPV